MVKTTFYVDAGGFVANAFERELRTFGIEHDIDLTIDKVKGFFETRFFITAEAENKSTLDNLKLAIQAIEQ